MKSIRQLGEVLFHKFRTLILYGIIGSFSAGTDFTIFYLLTNILGVFYVPGNIISVTIGITLSFILNRKYNFKVRDRVLKRFLVFLSVGFGGLILSSVLLFLFIDILILDKMISKALSIVFVVVIQFLLNKFITFRSTTYE